MQKRKVNKKLLFVLSLLVLLFLPLAFAYKDVDVTLTINPQGVITKDYNVIGDIFSYNINLTNTDGEEIEDIFSVKIYLPGRELPEKGIEEFNISLSPNESETLIPYIDKSLNNDTHIWPFEVSGDYKIEICSLNKDIKFIKRYLHGGYYYNHNCFTYYFSAMPEWEYKLFQEESSAAKKVEEVNERLLTLTEKMEEATQSMRNTNKWMLLVAILTAFIAYKTYKINKP